MIAGQFSWKKESASEPYIVQKNAPLVQESSKSGQSKGLGTPGRMRSPGGDWWDSGLRSSVLRSRSTSYGGLGTMRAAVLLGIAEMGQETRRERLAAGISVVKKAGMYRGRKAGTRMPSPSGLAAPRPGAVGGGDPQVPGPFQKHRFCLFQEFPSVSQRSAKAATLED